MNIEQDKLNQVVTSDYPVGIYTSTFTGDEAFFVDHIIQGKKILPGMAYVEMVRAAVASSTTVGDEQYIELSESVFVQPLLATEQCTIEIKVYPGRVSEFGIEVSTGQGVHFQSKAYVLEKKELPAPLDIQELAKLCVTDGPDKNEVYANFRKLGVHYGPSHQGIESIKLGKSCALVDLSLPNSSQLGMDLNPGMLDSIIQSGAVLSSRDKGLSVPFAIKKTKIFGSLTDTVQAHVVRTDDGIDYSIVDNKGDVKVVISGFIARELDQASQQNQLVFYKPEWKQDKITVEENQTGEECTTVTEQATYADLVKEIFVTVKKLILSKTEKHIIEVKIPSDKPSWRGIIGLLKTVALEYPKISYRLKVGDQVQSLDYSKRDLAPTLEYRWPNDSVIIITGGLGGLGKIIAEDIARHSSGCNLVLVGRSELDAKKKDTIKTLEKLGANIAHEICDITKQSDVRRLISKYSRVEGIIHGAGIIFDNYISNKTIEEIDRVLSPKVDGLKYLDQTTAKIKLKFFITLSSMAGSLGNAGQVDYAAANGYMDAYILNRAEKVIDKKRYGRSISINWPLWESDGMQVDDAIVKNMAQLKLKPLPVEAGLAALRQIIASNQNQLLVLFGNKKAIESMYDKSNNAKKKSQSQSQSQSKDIETHKLSREILKEIKMQTAALLKIKPHQLDEDADWAEFGFDSILLSSFINKFNAEFELDLMPTALFEATNMQLFSEYLTENYPREMAEKLSLTDQGEEIETVTVTKPDSVTRKSSQEPAQLKVNNFAQSLKKSYRTRNAYREKDIAIVGMSCRIAGARNLKEFWEILVQEKNMVTEIPSNRWNWNDYPESNKWGSFIDGVAEFDPEFFGISAAEAMYMVPEQRLLMQYVWECLENAGCGGDEIRGTNTGIFIGCGASSYPKLLSHLPIEAYSATGLVPSVGPNRISYLMDWHGPSEPVETACSSALVALHRAVESIRSGHCDQAITGGVNLQLSPESYISFTKAGMLADDGKCKPFSSQANGYVRGEGIGILMLKPLKTAIRDGSHILALVKGAAENHGGRSNSLTAPNPKSQAAVIKKAIKDADVEFSRVSYIECHGTGTQLGDSVEVESLKAVEKQLIESNSNSHLCKLGSIKSNIGHLELASGVVGVIKVVLQMQHKKIVKSLHSETINPYVNLAGTSFEIAQNASEWNVASGESRVAGVSSFGFGGVNTHVILEEFKDVFDEMDKNENTEQSPQLIVISARDEDSLLDYVAEYPKFIKTLPRKNTTLRNLAYTLQLGRSELQERVVFIAKSIDDLSDKIDNFLLDNGKVHSRSVYRGTANNSSADYFEIADTVAGKEYLKRLMETNEQGKLAELWVKGNKIDWRSLWDT